MSPARPLCEPPENIISTLRTPMLLISRLFRRPISGWCSGRTGKLRCAPRDSITSAPPAPALMRLIADSAMSSPPMERGGPLHTSCGISGTALKTAPASPQIFRGTNLESSVDIARVAIESPNSICTMAPRRTPARRPSSSTICRWSSACGTGRRTIDRCRSIGSSSTATRVLSWCRHVRLARGLGLPRRPGWLATPEVPSLSPDRPLMAMSVRSDR